MRWSPGKATVDVDTQCALYQGAACSEEVLATSGADDGVGFGEEVETCGVDEGGMARGTDFYLRLRLVLLGLFDGHGVDVF